MDYFRNSPARTTSVKLNREVVALIEARLKPGEDISDGIERIINTSDEVNGCLRALFQAIGLSVKPKKDKTGVIPENVELINLIGTSTPVEKPENIKERTVST
jgi:hypothetical protein